MSTTLETIGGISFILKAALKPRSSLSVSKEQVMPSEKTLVAYRAGNL